MIAQVLKRGLLLVAVLGMVFAMAPAGASAQPVVPDAGTCDGPARTPEEIAALQPGSATPFIGRERQRVERVGEASAEDIEAIAQTVADFFACFEAQDYERFAAFFTDAAAASGNFVLTPDENVDASAEFEFLGVFGAWTLSDGRVAVLIVGDDSTQTFPITSTVLIFAKVDGRWLIDDLSF